MFLFISKVFRGFWGHDSQVLPTLTNYIFVNRDIVMQELGWGSWLQWRDIYSMNMRPIDNVHHVFFSSRHMFSGAYPMDRHVNRCLTIAVKNVQSHAWPGSKNVFLLGLLSLLFGFPLCYYKNFKGNQDHFGSVKAGHSFSSFPELNECLWMRQTESM